MSSQQYSQAYCPIRDSYLMNGMAIREQLHYATPARHNVYNQEHLGSRRDQYIAGYNPGNGSGYSSDSYQQQGMYADMMNETMANAGSSSYQNNNHGSVQQQAHHMNQMTDSFSNLNFRRTPGANAPAAQDNTLNNPTTTAEDEDMRSPSPIRILSPVWEQQRLAQEQDKDKGKETDSAMSNQEVQSSASENHQYLRPDQQPIADQFLDKYHGLYLPHIPNSVYRPIQVYQDTSNDNVAEVKPMELLTRGFFDGPPTACPRRDKWREHMGFDGPPIHEPAILSSESLPFRVPSSGRSSFPSLGGLPWDKRYDGQRYGY